MEDIMLSVNEISSIFIGLILTWFVILGAREFLKPRKWTWKSERRPSFHRMGSDVDFVPTKGSEDDILLRSLIG